ncbi:MAG TPA: phosphoribosyltransferase [Nitratifractor sp.]|nr:phosphoribosyltransferase [Nitratifractor sp.]
MEKKYYGYSEFLGDVKELSAKVKEYNPDTLLAVARGGLTLGHFMAQALDTRRLFALNSIHYEKESKLETIEIFNIPDLKSAKRVVLIDDIVDSGETLSEIIKVLQKAYPHCEFKLATIFYKPTAIIQADYTLKEAKEWIDFFWEVDPL